LKNPILWTVHGVATVIAMSVALWAVFFYAPADVQPQMGASWPYVQRIFYFHVAAAISAGLCYLLVFVGSVGYLRTRQDRWDHLGHVAAELGVMFSVFVLISGPLWARPIWGVFWRWEPRLTTMMITFTIYVAYLMVRSYGEPGERTQRFAAVVGIFAFVMVPFVRYSINLWAANQQLHPPSVELDPAMATTKYLAYFAFALLFSYLLRLRLSQERNADRLQELVRQRGRESLR
jgi:heme exporter protein C